MSMTNRPTAGEEPGSSDLERCRRRLFDNIGQDNGQAELPADVAKKESLLGD